jgi:hypothetical protein
MLPTLIRGCESWRQTPAINPCGLIVLTVQAPTEVDDKNKEQTNSAPHTASI